MDETPMYLSPRTWYRHRRVVINAVLFGRRLQVWLWGARVMPGQSRLGHFRVDEFMFWRIK